MKHKYEVAEVFSKFKRWVENQSGYKIQAVRSYNAIEYISQRFNSLCEEVGVEHQFTAPRTHNKTK